MDPNEKVGALTNSLKGLLNIPIHPQVLKGLSDKFYERRKGSALEVEKLIREALSQGDHDRIASIIGTLVTDFAYSIVPNSRNGGLISLAAVAIALGTSIDTHMDAIVPPILACFNDQDSRVRYYACEALYNVSKVARQGILKWFNEIFDALSKLSVDVEVSVKNGAELLDRLIKDIVSERSLFTPAMERDGTPHPLSESPPPTIFPPLPSVPGATSVPKSLLSSFNLPRFIPLLAERIFVTSPQARLFLVQWINILNSVPDLDLISYLPEFCDGLFRFLSDPNSDVRTATVNVLGEFLKEIQEVSDAVKPLDFNIPGNKLTRVDSDDRPRVDFPRLIEILIPYVSSRDEETQATALRWMNDFINLAREAVIPYTPSLLPALLPSISHPSSHIRSLAFDTNSNLFSLIMDWNFDQPRQPGDGSPTDSFKARAELFDTPSSVSALSNLFQHEYEDTRVASLEWLLMLHKKSPTKVIASDQVIFKTLLRILSDLSEEVVKRDLQLLAQISQYSDDEHFMRFVRDLLELFANDRKLLESRGSLIIRQLCVSLNPERMYKAFADNLENELDLEFASTMVQNLSLILITSPELSMMRKKLRNLDIKEGALLFGSLYKSWCHNAVSAFSLCLLAQAYDQASALLTCFADLEISVTFLIQVDKLVQLLESPVFTHLRLQLLEPERNPALLKCLYGILMLLPQSSAFATLRNRLNSVSTLALMQTNGTASSSKRRSSNPTDTLKWADLLTHFKTVQAQHEASKRPRSKSLQSSQELNEWYSGPARKSIGSSRPSRVNSRPLLIPRNNSTSSISGKQPKSAS